LGPLHPAHPHQLRSRERSTRRSLGLRHCGELGHVGRGIARYIRRSYRGPLGVVDHQLPVIPYCPALRRIPCPPC
jgi:hypothetical protein